MAERTLYQVLMVDPAADREVITEVCRLLARRYLSEHGRSSGAAERLAEMNAASAILLDPARRAAYDASIGLASEKAAPGQWAAIPIEPMPGGGAAPSAGDAAAASVYGEAGPPPQNLPASGTVLPFGRYRGWTIWQVGRHDHEYLEWLRRTPNGWAYAGEIAAVLGRPARAR